LANVCESESQVCKEFQGKIRLDKYWNDQEVDQI